MAHNEKDQRQLTIGHITYISSGNILFAEGEEGTFYLAESQLLDKVDKAIQQGILDNGMQMLLKKIRG